MSKLDRRHFLIGAGGAAVAGVSSPATVFAQTPPRPPQPPQPPAPTPPQIPTPTRAQPALRMPVGLMAPDDPTIVAYRLAVERMKALPAGDPRNWNSIAQIHVNYCPHSNWFFLPWHRAYLIMFERVCRQVLNDPNFALPYWDWTEQRQLPPAFAEATVGGRPNALFNSTRVIRPDEQIPSGAVAQDAILRIMLETNFENFGSLRPIGQNSTEARWLQANGTMTPLENGPHGVVHSTIGGDMGDMGSPLDPVFFLHHCNIDRLWAWWNALGRRNSTDPLWTGFQFNGIFQMPQGQGLTAWNVGVTDMFDHLAWGYTYPELPGSPSLLAAQMPPPGGGAPPPGAGGPPPGGPGAPPPGGFPPPSGAPPAGGFPPPGGGVPTAGGFPPPGGAPPPGFPPPVAALPPGVSPFGAVPPPDPSPAAVAADAGPPQTRVIAAEAGRGSAKLNTVLSTRLTLLSPAPIESKPARRPEADVAPAPHRHSDPTSILRESPLEQTSTPPAPKAPTPPPGPPAGGPAAGAPAAALPNGRVFSVLENIRTTGTNTVRVNVFLNHPNPTAATPESDPHFVGTFGLFGLRSHAAHNGMSVQLELTRTIDNLRRRNLLPAGQLDLQLIPVGGQGSATEVMNPERIRIVTM